MDFTPATWLPVAFAGLMGLSVLLYVVLDGYDLGVGILSGTVRGEHRDRMIASIGPFWDANETWLVLAVGLLLVAFPQAHGAILGELYLPVAGLLLGLILRGVAFEFRAKSAVGYKVWWDRAFVGGSTLAALMQGYMLGLYIVGFERTPANVSFALLTALCLVAGYAFIGAAWLIMKTEGELQRRAVAWARGTLLLSGIGMVAVSVVTPLVSERIWDKWLSLPNFVLLAPIPLVTAGLFVGLSIVLPHLPTRTDRFCWMPFVGAVGIFMLGFHGLAYSFFPYIVPDKLTVWQAAAAPESLMIMFVGALLVLPIIAAYSAFAYRIFWGKATDLRYY
ncbi:cytochrome d ubiquinol oxidase subunit II [Microvirga aerophila]|uniref:Cytochrome bd ubiquinol oxidase subunit II n=1 Tax=Microvirga aerophila TaxID=670291 RepID=A0A512BVP8_9HYPH|nr:cytochrome d ubiquinol oxidase subunit II [Microvirga aerophila]GEO16039.1 cytochrome bd ubiquinol oxidase subunit II [Microvirga aerophila]